MDHRLKFGLSLLGSLVFFFAPAAYLVTDILSVSNEVHISATVPEKESSTVTDTDTSGGGGGGRGSGDNSTNSDSSNEEDDGQSGEDTTIDEDLSDGTEPGSTVVDETPENSTEPVQEVEPDLVPEPSTTTVHFGGYAFPNAQVTFTLNGDIVNTVTADSSGYFEGTYDSVFMGENNFSFIAEDLVGNASHLVTYVYTVVNESPVYISSILLPPIFEVSNTGELTGTAIPGSTIEIIGIEQSDQSLHPVGTATVLEDGTYVYTFDLKNSVVYDQYFVACEWKGTDCGYSETIQVQTVGESYKFVADSFADFSSDVKVNYIDFAFIRAAFLKANSNPLYDLNRDGKITLIDFSLLNYQWSL